MQFASSAAEIEQTEELQLPTSTSEVEAAQALSNVIKVDSSLKQGGGTGWLITPLLNAAKQHRDRLKMIAHGGYRLETKSARAARRMHVDDADVFELERRPAPANTCPTAWIDAPARPRR